MVHVLRRADLIKVEALPDAYLATKPTCLSRGVVVDPLCPTEPRLVYTSDCFRDSAADFLMTEMTAHCRLARSGHERSTASTKKRLGRCSPLETFNHKPFAFGPKLLGAFKDQGHRTLPRCECQELRQPARPSNPGNSGRRQFHHRQATCPEYPVHATGLKIHVRMTVIFLVPPIDVVVEICVSA